VSLGRKLAGGLKDMRGTSGSYPGGVIEAQEGRCRARAQAREFDRLAVLLDEVEVWTTLPKPSAEEVGWIIEKQAAQIEKKICYLVESFRMIEFDRREDVLQMRSTKPFSDGVKRQYFELILTGGWKATLRRYKGSEKDPGRQTVAISLTMDVLERFVDDLSVILMDRKS